MRFFIPEWVKAKDVPYGHSLTRSIAVGDKVFVDVVWTLEGILPSGEFLCRLANPAEVARAKVVFTVIHNEDDPEEWDASTDFKTWGRLPGRNPKRSQGQGDDPAKRNAPGQAFKRRRSRMGARPHKRKAKASGLTQYAYGSMKMVAVALMVLLACGCIRKYNVNIIASPGTRIIVYTNVPKNIDTAAELSPHIPAF